MKSCWLERSEERPKFGDVIITITHRVQLPTLEVPVEGPEGSGDAFYDTIAPHSDDDEETPSALEFLDDEEDESLYSSILNLLPGTYGKTNGVVGVTTPPSGPLPPESDYYTDMKPLPRATRNENERYNMSKPITTTSSNYELKRMGRRDCKPIQGHGTSDHKGTQISRNASTCSDYCPMFSAAPAKPCAGNT